MFGRGNSNCNRKFYGAFLFGVARTALTVALAMLILACTGCVTTFGSQCRLTATDQSRHGEAFNCVYRTANKHSFTKLDADYEQLFQLQTEMEFEGRPWKRKIDLSVHEHSTRETRIRLQETGTRPHSPAYHQVEATLVNEIRKLIPRYKVRYRKFGWGYPWFAKWTELQRAENDE